MTAPRAEGAPTSMALDIRRAFNPSVITPFTYLRRNYFVLFHYQVEGPFVVTDSPYQVNSMVSVGEIKKGDEVVGNIFYTQLPVICTGSFLLVHSGVFADQVNKRPPRDLNMPLVVKTKMLQIFAEKNKAVLIVSPFLKKDILDVLEM